MSIETKNFKSIIVERTIIVIGYKNDSHYKSEEVPINLTIKAYELNYGPVIDFTVSVDIPYEPGVWIEHPFLIDYQLKGESKDSVGDIIDDTPAIRAIIMELANPEKKELLTTTDCRHRSGLIASLRFFYS